MVYQVPHWLDSFNMLKYLSPHPRHKEPLVFPSLILERKGTVMQKLTENWRRSMLLGVEYLPWAVLLHKSSWVNCKGLRDSKGMKTRLKLGSGTLYKEHVHKKCCALMRKTTLIGTCNSMSQPNLKERSLPRWPSMMKWYLLNMRGLMHIFKQGLLDPRLRKRCMSIGRMLQDWPPLNEKTDQILLRMLRTI